MTENAGLEIEGPKNSYRLKMSDQIAGHEIAGHELTDQTTEHEIAGHENTGHENERQKLHFTDSKQN